MNYSSKGFPKLLTPNSALPCTSLLNILIIFGTCPLLDVCSSALAQERLSPSAVEELVKDVHPKRVVELIKQRGVNFELTDELRTRFKKAGAGSEVMQTLELAVIRYRLAQGGEKSKSYEPSNEKPNSSDRQIPPTKTDSATDKGPSKTAEPARGREIIRRPPNEERSSEGASPEKPEQKVVKLPSQLQDRADHALRVENVSIKEGEVSGELMNISQQSVFGVQFQVLYSWRWNNDFRPGGQDPGRAEYFTIDREIRPGERVTFNHKPSPPLPTRQDGSFDISVKVIAFSKIFR